MKKININLSSFSSVITEPDLNLHQNFKSMTDISKEREELVEMFGVHFETYLNFSPLSGRILGCLIVWNDAKGLTFDDLVSRLGASKSSVSTNLNLLLKIGKIQYYTFPGDRKKYYKPSSFSDRMQNHLRMVLDEKKMVERMIEYRKMTADTDECSDLEKIKIYQEHVIDFEKFLNKTIQKLEKVENK